MAIENVEQTNGRNRKKYGKSFRSHPRHSHLKPNKKNKNRKKTPKMVFISTMLKSAKILTIGLMSASAGSTRQNTHTHNVRAESGWDVNSEIFSYIIRVGVFCVELRQTIKYSFQPSKFMCYSCSFQLLRRKVKMLKFSDENLFIFCVAANFIIQTFSSFVAFFLVRHTQTHTNTERQTHNSVLCFEFLSLSLRRFLFFYFSTFTRLPSHSFQF